MANKADEATERRRYWADEISKAKKRFNSFHTGGEKVVDEYRIQKSDNNEMRYQDKYNILYSSTETIRPNLYAQTPMVRVQLRHKDRPGSAARDAVMLLEANLKYLVDEEDFDEVMESCVEDLLLPGIGCAWVRYEPKLGIGPDGEEQLLDEMVRIDYVYWQDILTGSARGWRTMPWIAKRSWLTKEAAAKRFGKDKSLKLTYTDKEKESREDSTESDTCEVWEIWDKRAKKVFWYSENYPNDVLDYVDDPLRLHHFWPCPRPMRAISNTRTFVPRPLYSQYKAQAETLNTQTKRIRLLSEALRVVGVYDGSQAILGDVLNSAMGNRMVAVQSWAAFAQAGGIKGSIEWLPIEQVVATLNQLIQAREVCKNEIYEITGFSDIVRGVSKASETLGAQNIKQNWAGARVKKMQKDVQRFARDLIAIVGEVVAEHCNESTIALFGGVDIPSEEQMALPENQALLQRFKVATEMLKMEGRRVAQVNIETDSTVLADESMEREDRMKFLASAGAFLQQAVPAMEATPQLGPLLGAMLMFGVRTFPSSRPIEEEFEKLQKVISQMPEPSADKDGKGAEAQAKAQAATGVAQIRAQVDTKKIDTEAQLSQVEAAAKERMELAKLDADKLAENNRHNEKMAELTLKEREVAVREREVAVKEAELGIKQQQADTQEAVAEHSASMAEASHEQEYDKMDRADEQAERESLTDSEKSE